MSSISERVRKPLFRGRLTSKDSAETQWGLVIAGNGEGKVYWLVEMNEKIVKKARFLSFGKIQSISLLDGFCELAEEKSLEKACSLSITEIAELIGENPAELDADVIKDLQSQVLNNIGSVVVEEPIEESEKGYQRKDERDMDEHDRAWIPLGAPDKIRKVNELLSRVLRERTSYGLEEVTLYDISRDFLIKIKYAEGVVVSERPTLTKFFAEACRSEIHPQLKVEEVAL